MAGEDGATRFVVELNAANLRSVTVVRPGDILIINAEPSMSEHDIADAMQTLREHAPGVRGIIVHDARSIHTINGKE